MRNNTRLNRYLFSVFFTMSRLTLFLLIAAASVSAETIRTVTISTDDHPPLLQSNTSPEKDQGIMTDIVREAFLHQGIQVKYMAVPASRIVWSLLENQVSATVGPMGWFENKNAGDIVHGIPIFPAFFHFYYMKKHFPQGLSYVKLEDLKGYRIGYMYGGAANYLLEEAGLTVEKVNDRDQNTRKLFLGRIDLLITESMGGWASIKKIYPNNTDEFEMSDLPILDAPGCIIFMKDRKELIQTFQRGFDAVRRNGTYLKTVKRYYDQRKIPQKVLDIIK